MQEKSESLSLPARTNKYQELTISIENDITENELNSLFVKISKSNLIKKLNIEIWSINEHLLELLSENLVICSLSQTLSFIGISLQAAKSLGSENLKKIAQLLVVNNKLKSLCLYGMSCEEITDTEIVKSLFAEFNYSSIEELVIDRNALAAEGIQFLSQAISKCNMLKMFEFNDVMADDDSNYLKILGQALVTCTELTKFKFYGNKDANPVNMTAMLSGLLNCHKLSSINIFNVNQLAELILPLCQILNNNAKTLYILQLAFWDNSKIKNEQIKLLCESISHCHSLNSLILKPFDIDAVSMKYIIDALSKIDTVYISDNNENQNSNIDNLFNNEQTDGLLQSEEDWRWCINFQGKKGVHWRNRDNEGTLDLTNDGLLLQKIGSIEFSLGLVY